MNPNLSVAETEALLDVLSHGMSSIRSYAANGDVARAEAIADALHNVPRLISQGHAWGWTIASFRELFLSPLIERYPDLALIEQPLELLGAQSPPARRHDA